MTDPGYGLFDADTHMYDREDSFSRYLPQKYAELGVKMDAGPKEFVAYAGGKRVVALDAAFGPGGNVVRPGSLKELLRQMRNSEGETPYAWIPVRDEFVYRDARLACMDEQNVDAALVFPSIVLTIEGYYDDGNALYAQIHAFNRWFAEEWGFAYKDRIFATPWISLRELEKAVAEVEYVIEQGARAVTMRVGPAYGRSPADPYFDPVWARLDEAEVAATYHIADGGYNRDVSTLWGEEGNPPARLMSAWQWNNTYGDRPIMDTISALIFGNLFGRFPNLRVAAVEHGAEWAPYLVKHMDKSRGLGRQGPWIGGPLTERPSAIFNRHVRVVPYPEDDVASLTERLGADVLMMGSDYPHAEGLAEPQDFIDLCSEISITDARKILRDNGMALVGL